MRFVASQQAVAWFFTEQGEGRLSLSPPYQRRPVWTLRQQSHLVESILLELPIPEIFLQQTNQPDGTVHYTVVDGQQRIRAILEFVGDAEEPGFALGHVDPASPHYGRSFRDLTEAELAQFWGYRLAVRMLDDATNADLRDLFQRINRYLTPLTAQELRNATYSGPFARLAEHLANDEFWSERGIIAPRSIRRMADIEFVSDLLIGVMHGPQGGDRATLDDYYAMYEEYETAFPDEPQVTRQFARTRDIIETLFPDLRQHRWHNKTDFYSLFVALAGLLPAKPPAPALAGELRDVLDNFEREVEAWAADDQADVAPFVPAYVRAVQRGSPDKSRRTARHQALVSALRPVVQGVQSTV